MTVDRDVMPDTSRRVVPAQRVPPVLPAPPAAPAPPAPPVPRAVAAVSRATIFWYSAVGVVLLGWFLWGWLVIRQGFIDSVGESIGTAFALLLVVSVIGTVRSVRRSASTTGREPPP